MATRLNFEVKNIRQTKTYLNRVEGSIQSLRPFFRNEARSIIVNRIRRLFRTRAEGRWAPLAESTIRRKGHDTILRETDRLFTAATGGRGSIERIRNRSYQLGIDKNAVPYAEYHETPFGTRPARPIYAFLGRDRGLRLQLQTRLNRYIRDRINNLRG